MKQGSILSYLQPRNKAPTQQDLSVTNNSEQTETTPDQLLTTFNTESRGVQNASFKDKGGLIRILETTTTTYATESSHPRAAITKVLPSHIDRLKSITTTLLPVRYSHRFFAECLDPDNSTAISFVSLFDAKPVGWIRCRLEPFPSENNPIGQQLYIQALGILAPYRGIGLASALFGQVLSVDSTFQSIYAHVWETNEDALRWYDKHGFTRVLLIPQYYRRLSPSGAWVLRKELK